MSIQDVNAIASRALELLENWQLPEARQLYEKITAIAPDNADAWNRLCKLNVMTGRYEQAEHSCRTAVNLLPDSLEPLTNLANTLTQLGKHGEAAAIYQKLVTLQPDSPELTYALGAACLGSGQLEQATNAFLKTIELNPNHADCHLNLGLITGSQNKYPEAEKHFQTVLSLNPGNAVAHTKLAFILQRTGKYREALGHYDAAIESIPAYVDAHFGRANTLVLLGQPEAAIESLKNVIRLNPSHVNAYINIATATLALGNADVAMEYCKQAIKLNPDNTTAISLAATIEHRMGNSAQALARLQPWVDGGIQHVDVAIAYAEICKSVGRQDDAIEAIHRILKKNETLHINNQCHLHFHLGHLYDKTGQYDKAFSHYSNANKLKRAEYFPLATTQLTDAIIATHSPVSMAALPRARIQAHKPVFVVGMPRSGTSLVEQILSSHPKVFGAGELDEITRIIIQLPETLGNSHLYPYCMSSLNQVTIDHLCKQYLERINSVDPHAERVVDKTPGNFRFLGMIALLFPNAHVVHCVRNPLDTILSCYFQNFSGDHPYAYDLDHLGSYYKEYLRLIQHWKSTLNIPILDVAYEDLIDNQEVVSRSLVEFCGLEWDKACLSFHQAERFVATSSYEQVRRPLYRDSVSRWKHYERHIGPLIDTMGE